MNNNLTIQNSYPMNTRQVLNTMANDLRTLLQQRDIKQPIMVGIHTAGVWLAEILHRKLAIKEKLGKLNANFYRDDFDKIGLHSQIAGSDLPFSIEDKHVILVDDVLFSGRTTRAAMNELFDYGRPASIILAVLVDRDAKKLPIEAQVIGITKKLASNYFFKLGDRQTLKLMICKRND